MRRNDTERPALSKGTEKQRPLWFYRLLLASAAMVWGLGFAIGKGAIAVVGATWFTAFRFLGAVLLLSVFLWPHVKRHLNRTLVRAGVIMGVFSFLGFWTQFIGLGLTTPSKNAFLSACYCVTVPLIWWVVARRRPHMRTFAAAAMCTVGIGLVSLDGGLSIGLGDAASILSAFLYGVEIVVIALFMKDNDVIATTFVQQLTAGILALAAALATTPLPSLGEMANPGFIGSMAYVIVLSAAYGAIAQNLAQKHLSASEAGLLCSSESVFCAVFSVAFFDETLTLKMVAGFALIFASIVAAQLSPDSQAPRENRSADSAESVLQARESRADG